MIEISKTGKFMLLGNVIIETSKISNIVEEIDNSDTPDMETISKVIEQNGSDSIASVLKGITLSKKNNVLKIAMENSFNGLKTLSINTDELETDINELPQYMRVIWNNLKTL